MAQPSSERVTSTAAGEMSPPFGSLLDALPIGVLLLDAQGAILFANAFERTRTGKSAQQLSLDWFVAAAIPDLAATVTREQYAQEVVASGKVLRAEVSATDASGDHSLAVTISPMQGLGAVSAVVTIEDRTALARESERRSRAERLAAVGEVAASVAHEVNNPLASIKSFAQLLAREAASPEQREALELIISESTRVAGIVENLLSYSRRQSAVGLQQVDLSAIAERVLQTQQYALAAAGILVRRDFDKSLSLVTGEAGALQQVVLNLVVNAEEALAGQSGERRLIIRTRESTEGIIMAVVDNGPGISRETLPVIFERFRTTKAGGTGLGLAISAAIVRDHGGQIWAESDEGKGTAFYVILPRAATQPQSTDTAAPIAPRETPLARGLRVLIADDEPALRRALSMFLERRGHSVVQASNADEAFEIATGQHVDVALIDARMPGDGLALIERLEKLPGLHGRTALMTGDIGRARTRQGVATERPCLSKPFDMDEMVRLLEALAG